MKMSALALKVGFSLFIGLSSSFALAHKNKLEIQNEPSTIQPLHILNGYNDVKSYILIFLDNPSLFQVILVKEFNTAATRFLNEFHIGKYLLVRELNFKISIPCFSSTEGRFVTVDDQTVQVRDSETSLPITVRMSTDSIQHTAISPDGTRIFIALHNGTSEIWDIETGEHTVLDLDCLNVWSAVFSPEGNKIFLLLELEEEEERVASGQVWDIKKGQLPSSIWKKRDIRLGSFSPDGMRFVALCAPKKAILWDADTGQEIALIKVDSIIIRCAFSNNGKNVAIVSHGRGVQIWHGETGEFIDSIQQSIPSETEAIVSSVFSANKRRVATKTGSSTIKIWDLETSLLVTTLNQPPSHALESSSRDGKRIATRSVDGIVAIWDADTGRHVTTLRGLFKLQGVFHLTNGKIMTRANNAIATWEYKRIKDINEIKKEISRERWHVVPPSKNLDSYFEELPSEVPIEIQF